MHFPFPWQIALVLLVILVIFGASRLPELGKSLGEGIRNFKKGLSEEEEENPKLNKKEDE
ncbi:MAG: twin-arginine translocase TatA/TatE family subunit [Aquificae bacterium]|nr:twin-arginine translocase TatA/TatE family subunit [Aquificota bacterium]